MAGGGVVDAGTTHLVGENGPEQFTPSGPGFITPNNAINNSNSNGSVQVNITVNAQTGSSQTSSQGDNGNALKVGNMIADQVRAVILAEKRNGGLLA